ncbi:MAG: zinc ribbon domain-containing protein [Lachnospiraceae bacterium]|nr:zinc ribbon domain-containing protein [Lachnospiraceae bacterium]
MRICANCGNKLGKKDRFCGKCGSSEINETTSIFGFDFGPKTKKCIYCGTTLEGKAKFCWSCGKSTEGGISLSFLDEKKQSEPSAQLGGFAPAQEQQPAAEVTQMASPASPAPVQQSENVPELDFLKSPEDFSSSLGGNEGSGITHNPASHLSGQSVEHKKADNSAMPQAAVWSIPQDTDQVPTPPPLPEPTSHPAPLRISTPDVDPAEAEKIAAEEAAKRAEEERKAAEEAAKKAEEERKLAEEAAKKAEEEKKRAEEEAARKAEEERKKAEEERKKAEEEAKKKAEEERKKAEEEAKKKAEEERKKAEEEAKKKAEEAKKAEEERLKLEEEKKKAEEERKKAEEEAKKKAEEARKAAEEAAKKAEEERKKAEEEAKKKAEEERKKAEEEARKKAEEARKAAEEAAKKAEEERKKAEEEAKKKAEEEAKKKAEEERKKAEEEAARKAKEEAERKALAELRKVADTSATAAIKATKKGTPESYNELAAALDKYRDYEKKTGINMSDEADNDTFISVEDILGTHYYDEDAFKLAVPLISDAARHGKAKSGLYYVDHVVRNRTLMPEDEGALKNILDKAMEDKDIMSNNDMKIKLLLLNAKIYKEGLTVKKNMETAFGYYKQAAELGSAKGTGYVGNCLLYGDGVKRDTKAAFEWNMKAAEAGEERGIRNVAVAYDYGTGIKHDALEAVKWYKKLLEIVSNDRFAKYRIAYSLANPDKIIGFRPDESQLKEAYDYAEAALEAGEGEAEYVLGYLKTLHVNGGPNYTESYTHFAKVANRGNEKAREWMAKFVKNGNGTYMFRG